MCILKRLLNVAAKARLDAEFKRAIANSLVPLLLDRALAASLRAMALGWSVNRSFHVAAFRAASFVEFPMNRLQIIPARWHSRQATALHCKLCSGRSEWRLIQVLFSSTGGGGPPA
jgi:hypothetical protein